MQQSTHSTIQLDLSLHGEVLKILPREWQAEEHGVSSMEYLEEQTIRKDLVEHTCREIGEILNRDSLRESGHPKYLDRLRTAGNVLYTELFGPETKRTLHHTTASTLILSLGQDLLYIPWELLHDGEEFLCLRFHIGRVVKVQQGIPEIKKTERTLPFRMLLLYDPAVDPDLSIRERIMAVQRECNQYGELLTVDLDMQRIEYTFLRDAFAHYDLFHCRSHIVFAGAESGWLLQNGQKFSVHDLYRIAESQIPMPMLTFSDGCESAKTGFMAIEHLALAFLRCGVRHYIGTLCKIPPASSAYFTLTFYRALLDGASVGNAIWQARKALTDRYTPERLVWGSYVLYGDPTLKLFSIEDLFRSLENDPRRLLEQGIRLEKQHKWMQALACYRQAEQYVRDKRPSDGQHNVLPDILFHIGMLLYKQGKYAQAQRYLNNTLRISKTRTPAVLNELALAHWKQGNWDEARRLCQESFSLAQAAGDLFQCAKACHYLGVTYRFSGDVRQSFRPFEQAIDLYTQLRQERELAKVYDSYGGACHAIGDLENALRWYEQGKALDQKAGNRYGYSIGCGNIGRIWFLKGDLQQAEAYFLEDLRISEELENNFGIAKMYENLGHVCTQDHRLEQARQYYEKSLDISETIGDLVSQANACMGFAELNLLEDRPEDALELCDRASRILTPLNHAYGQTILKRLYGTIYTSQQDWALAGGYFQESLELAQNHHFELLQQQTAFELGLMQYARGDLDQALHTLDAVFRACTEKGWDWLQRKYEHTLRQQHGHGLLNVLHWTRQHISKDTMDHLLHPNTTSN